jgi:cystathionine beta-lyase
VHAHAGLVRQTAPLAPRLQGDRLRYEIDWEVFRSAFYSGGARTGMFLLCHPHNPTGHSYTREELLGMAETCLANDVVICSDEIHNELILAGGRHLPLAVLSPEIAARTITLVAPSKTFNIPGLFCAFAIIPDADLRARYKQATERMAMHVSSLSLTAAQAAFGGECDDWLAQLLAYLSASRDLLAERIACDLPGVRMTVPEATYMSWLDCSALVADGRIPGSPKKFFLDHARVALTDGADFGPGYENCVRLVFGCSQATLQEALARMQRALKEGVGGPV